MAAFVHVASASEVGRIRSQGLVAATDGGVYALPVCADAQAMNLLLQEQARRRGEDLAAVYFRVPDDTPVRYGYHRRLHVPSTARDAVAEVRDHRAEPGFEVCVPRDIAPTEITNVRPLPRRSSW